MIVLTLRATFAYVLLTFQNTTGLTVHSVFFLVGASSICTMAEIDTTAPFASVRDAVNMFGERSPVKTQRIFPTVNAANTEVTTPRQRLLTDLLRRRNHDQKCFNNTVLYIFIVLGGVYLV